ncbi:MAG TPA: 50S ribosomal protein L11 methyltransferase, partial [Woeseiaceae bacterium]|nr:50S ribosomal protein L11 methyltransferase [Woeseiaceae bacterium]
IIWKSASAFDPNLTMEWRQFVMDLGTLPAPEVEALFLRNGAQPITFSDAADAPVLEPSPGETALWRETKITGLFAPDQDLRRLADDLKGSFHLAGTRVLDFGCGSGILAIAALRLGARSATACDIDHEAITATTMNSARNAVDNRLTATLDAGTPRGDFDIVLANILAGTLVRNAPAIAAHLAEGGRLLLSGILEEQIEDVVQAYRGRVDFDAPAVRASWARLTGRKR